ncbi:MAG: hypothetical protein LBQ91_07015 [Oscillospiraceae bacterium]|nr:hypothetical protein [Oscillospiraceae bacterium]
MKKLKITALAAVFAVCFLLASCGNGNPSATTEPAAATPVTSPTATAETPDASPNAPPDVSEEPIAPSMKPPTDGWMLTYKGADIYLGSKLDDLIAKVGEPKGRIETADCAFGTIGFMVDFPGLQLTTTQLDGVDYIMAFELMDDSIKTNEGLLLQTDSGDKVKELMGEPQETREEFWIYTKGGTSLTFTVSGSLITNIQYYYDAAVTE